MKVKIALVLTLMLSGRAMTLAFLPDLGGPLPGDPPAAWLMPLLGDAIIGIAGLPVAYLILRGRGLGAWTAIVGWNVVGIWDALSAFLVHWTNPWPEFFMIRIFGGSMFFAAAAMHLVVLLLIGGASVRARYLPEPAPNP